MLTFAQRQKFFAAAHSAYLRRRIPPISRSVPPLRSTSGGRTRWS